MLPSAVAASSPVASAREILPVSPPKLMVTLLLPTFPGVSPRKSSLEQLANCYIADKVIVAKADYNKKVSITFHSLASKVTIGIYETIQGYSVKDVKFYASATDVTPSTTPTLYTTKNTIPTSSATKKMTVSYANGEKTPTVTFASEEAKSSKITFGSLGTGNLATEKTSATKPTDPTRILPANAGALTLKVDYTLVSDDGSNETIKVGVFSPFA